MNIERLPVNDVFIGFALSADAELLAPGNQQQAALWVAQNAPLRQSTPETATIFELSEEQRSRFTRGYALPTPASYGPASEQGLSRLGLLHLTIASSYGQAFGLKDQRDGVIIQDIFPRDDALERPNSSYGSTQNFEFHTDQAYNPNFSQVPDTVMLACIRNDELASTRVAHFPRLLSLLSEADIEVLREPRYNFYRGRVEEDLDKRVSPVIEEEDGQPIIRLGTDMSIADDHEAAKAALTNVRQTLGGIATDIRLEPGEMLIIPNKLTPHSRSPFRPNTRNSERRWLHRIFVHASDDRLDQIT